MCLRFKGDYWLLLVHAARTESFATAIDDCVLSLVQASMAVNSVLLGLLLQSQAIRFKGMRICNLQFSGSPIPSVNVGAVQSKIPLHDRKDVHSPQQHTTRAFSILCHQLKIFSGRNLFITPSQMLTNMNPTSNLHNRPRLRAIYNLHSNSRRL